MARLPSSNNIVIIIVIVVIINNNVIGSFGWRRQLTLLARTQEVKEPPTIFAPQAVRQLQPKPMVRPPGMPAQVIPAACPCQQRPMPHFVQPVLAAPPPPSFPQVPGKSLAFAPKSAPILPRQTLFARHASPPPGRLLVTRQTLPAQLPAWLMQARALPSSPRRTATPLRFASGQAPVFARHASPQPVRQ
ncbi:unnamed protein product [Symbiodinium sp. CCMP2592]|nr:unnamed protein product [Symbiodinium sp. CCMP2592]